MLMGDHRVVGDEIQRLLLSRADAQGRRSLRHPFGTVQRSPLPLRDSVKRLPGLLREITPSSEKYLLPITHEALHRRRTYRLSSAFLDSTAT